MPTSHSLAIQPISADDIDDIMQIEACFAAVPEHNGWSRNIFEDCLRNAQYSLFGTYEHKQLNGFMVLHQILDQAQLMNIVIAPQAQRQGLGKQLLEFGINYVEQQNASILNLEVRADNNAAIRLYKTLGFMMVGRRPNYYRNANGNNDAILMDRIISLTSN